jgi:hypothetical protein
MPREDTLVEGLQWLASCPPESRVEALVVFGHGLTIGARCFFGPAVETSDVARARVMNELQHQTLGAVQQICKDSGKLEGWPLDVLKRVSCQSDQLVQQQVDQAWRFAMTQHDA